MPNNTVAIVAASIAGLSAITGIVAAVAATRSSDSAKAALKSQKEVEHRRLALELAKLGQEILSKANTIQRLSDDIKQQYNSLALFTESSGNSKQKAFKDRVENNKSRVAEIVNNVQEANLTGEVIEEMSEKRIGELLITYTMNREELFEIFSVLSNESTGLLIELTIWQNKAINEY